MDCRVDIGKTWTTRSKLTRADQKRPLFQSQNNGARHNQESASTPDQGEPFAEKECGKQNDEGHTQLVDGGDARGFAKLESAKVTEPGQARGQAGQDEKDPCSRCEISDASGCEVAYAITQLKTRITEVRIAVAKFESTPATPTLARTAVAPAKTAESSDQ